MALFSIIIVSYRTGNILFDAIDAAFKNVEDSEIIIVNNGNDIETINKLISLEKLGKIRLINHNKNIGFGAACNLGAKSASADNLLFLNPDAIIQEGAADILANDLSSLHSPKLIGGIIVDENNIEQRGARRNFLSFKTFLGIDKFNYNKEPLGRNAEEMPNISGAFFAINKADFEILGGFDEGYFLHVEDIDICKRMWDLGGFVYSEPRAKAMHIGGTSNASSLFVEWNKTKGFIRYFFKNYKGISSVLPIIATPIIIIAIMGRAFIKLLIKK